MLPFPERHKEITHQLLSGKFILQNDEFYRTVAEERDMYTEFFKKTYDYELKITAEYICLKSTNEKDKNCRDFLIFLALICRELDKDGKDFKLEIESETFLVEEVSAFLSESSKKKEVIANTLLTDSKGDIDLSGFLNEWQRRNVIQYVGNNKLKFRFTKAIDLFFDYAVDLANEKLIEERNDFSISNN